MRTKIDMSEERLQTLFKPLDIFDKKTWPVLGADCFFERHDGFRFFGVRTGDYVVAKLYKGLIPLSLIAWYVPVKAIGLRLNHRPWEVN